MNRNLDSPSRPWDDCADYPSYYSWKSKMYTWRSFLWTADEFFIAYSLIPPRSLVTSVSLFLVGHTVEMYLKAASAKITGDLNEAIQFGHKIKDIWFNCKKHDPDFMPSFEIRESVYNVELFKSGVWNRLTSSDFQHFMANQSLYIIAKLLPDLKYLGTPMKSITGGFGLAFAHRDPFWIDFLKELRAYLQIPEMDHLDIIRQHVEDDSLPADTVAYLSELYK